MATYDQGTTSLASIAGILSGMPAEVHGQWFKSQVVHLDGYKFSHCRFDACDVRTTTGQFQIDHCFFADCTFQFSGVAQKIVTLTDLAKRPSDTRWPAYQPVANPDGTLSIG